MDNFQDNSTSFNHIYYYRLKQIDYDGAYSYGKIQSITPELYSAEVLIYPNPAENNVQVESTETIEEVELFSVSGANVSKEKYTINQQQSKKIDINFNDIESGIYLLRVNSEFFRLVIE